MQTFEQKSFFFAVFYQINMSKNVAFSKWVAEDRTAIANRQMRTIYSFFKWRHRHREKKEKK